MPSRGRPKKPGPRYPNGRHTDAHYRALEAQQHRARLKQVAAQRTRNGCVIESEAHRPEAVTPLGQFYLTGILGKDEQADDRYAAAQAYAALYMKAARCRDLPSPHPKCADLIGQRGGSSAPVDESAPARLDEVDAALGAYLPHVRALLIEQKFAPALLIPQALDIVHTLLCAKRQHKGSSSKKTLAA